MKNKLLSASVLCFGLIVSAVIVANGAYAQTGPETIQFPIVELGNCKNKEECKKYCDDAKHVDACIAFAEKNNLMSQEELSTAKKFIASGGRGPGGCTGQKSCQNYCDDINHIDSCVAFAEKTGILPPEQLAEAKQVQSAIAKGVKPPACRGKKECDAYCEAPGNMKECIAFGEASGFLRGRELDDAKKMVTAIENGATPPACRGREACDAYCSEPDHMEACMTFAQAAGFMTPEEAQNSEKMLVALRKGVKPPACRGKEECDTYCSDPTHSDECIQFAVAAGFMDEKEAEMAKRTGGRGPGGCVGKDACEAFCGAPANQEACIDFGRENGMISEEDAGHMQEGQQKFRESMQNVPSEVEDCLKRVLGSDTFEKMQSGQSMPPRDAAEKMGSCFSQMGPPLGQQEQQGSPPMVEGQNRGPMPPDGQRSPEKRFTPRMYPNQPPDGQREGMRPPGEPFAPGTYPSQPPPPPDGSSGAYQNQQTRLAPWTEQVAPTSGESASFTQPPPPPDPEVGAPEAPALQAAQIESTAPQSFNFSPGSLVAAVANALFGIFKH